VTRRSGDEKAAAAAGRGRLRASQADREQVIDTLKAAFVQGRLDKDEFDTRVGEAFTARTYAELAVVTADIPVQPVRAPWPSPPVRPRGDRTVSRGVSVIIAATVPTAGLWAGAGLSQTDNAAVTVLLWTFTIVWWGILLLIGAVMLESRQQSKRSGGQRPPRPTPGAGGKASLRPAPAAPAALFPQVGNGQRHIAEAARSDLPCRPVPWTYIPTVHPI